jgi:hypothetical protein
MFPVSNIFCVPKCCYQSVYCCLIRYFLVSYQQPISMLSNVREWTHVLLVNTPSSHLHSFCANGVSSGLATRVTLTWGSRGEVWRVYYTGVDLLISFLYRCTWLLLGCVLIGASCNALCSKLTYCMLRISTYFTSRYWRMLVPLVTILDTRVAARGAWQGEWYLPKRILWRIFSFRWSHVSTSPCYVTPLHFYPLRVYVCMLIRHTAYSCTTSWRVLRKRRKEKEERIRSNESEYVFATLYSIV